MQKYQLTSGDFLDSHCTFYGTRYLSNYCALFCN